jgi:glyoxylase-like metal-dependent hydrolase (beta-lactamase superfamily II)
MSAERAGRCAPFSDEFCEAGSAMPEYAVYAIKYAEKANQRASQNFIGGDPHDGPMPMDFFVWAAVSDTETIIVDTGFDEAAAARRGFTLYRPVAEGLKQVGIDADQVKTVVLTHLHWDHAGNPDLFQNARYHVQESEMRYCTGRCMCHQRLRRPYDVSSVAAMVHRVYEGRVEFHDGTAEIAPGITTHLVGGHTMGLQVVRVRTRRGWLVLASDAAHYYANIEEVRPFPDLLDVGQSLDAFNIVNSLADSPLHVAPGHDPAVLARFPSPRENISGIARLDAAHRS